MEPRNSRSLVSASLAGAAALGAVLVVRAPDAGAYALTGDALDVFHRTVRVFDNFGDAEANANATPDPSFPGFVGAELAIWKAAVEWSAERHGSGGGDPHQPYGLGSGGASFDFVWLGNATAVGSTDDNTCSEIAGTGGGVIAFTETPTSDGWRIRFYSDQVWFDDPHKASFVGGTKDLQGVAAHELGHALGLGHSSASGATMFAGVSAGGLAWRSIESDDAAGLQAIYGPSSAAKPRIETYDFPAPGVVRVTGGGFAAAQNELWFTPVASQALPVVVSGLASSAGGTEILAALPPGVGGGDVLVKVPGATHDSLSTPSPFDLAGPPCEMPVAYGHAKVASTGSPADIGWYGEPSVQTADLELSLFGPPAGETAVLFSGPAKQLLPFCGGELLVGGPFRRHATVQVDLFGSTSAPVAVPPSWVGTTRFFQWWFTDPGDPFGCGTSNALEIFFCP